MMHVRSATPEDAPFIAMCNLRMAWETEGLRLDPPTVEAGVRAVLADPTKGRYFVAHRGGHPAGVLMITWEWSDWRNGTIWWIQSVYVPEPHRRQGVFRALYQHVHERARAESAAGLRLYVEKNNATAQATYARLGMSMTHYYVMEEMFPPPGSAKS